MKKLTLLFFAMMPILTLGQINFESGYFISNNNVKTDCLIKNWDWRNNPKSFEFILKENDPVNTKTINEVKEFTILNNSKYVRFEVKIDRSSEQLTELSDQKDPSWNLETVFLKVLVEGEINLYMFQDSAIKRFFVSSGDHKNVEQLIFKEYILINDTKINKNNQYKQQLYMLMKEADFTNKDFENLKYKEEQLVDLFVKYNKIKNPDFNRSEVTKNKGSFNLKAILGSNFNSFNAQNSLSNATIDLDQKAVFKFGVELEFKLPYNKNKWAFFIDPNFQSYKAEQQIGSRVDKLEYSSIEIPVGLRHYFFLNESGESKLFANLGFAYAFPVNSSLQRFTGPLDISSAGNFFIGGGYTYSRYSIEFRYSFKREILNYSYWASEYKSYGVSLGYKFL